MPWDTKSTCLLSKPLSRFKNFDDSGYGFKIHRVDARYPEVMIDFKKDLS